MKYIVPCIALPLVACASSPTAIEIDIGYDEGWNLTELQLTAGTRSETTAASHTVTVIVPDEWAGTAQDIELLGLRGAESWAQGTASAAPELGETVTTSAKLSLLSCATSCVEGEGVCMSGGIATCEQQDDSCFDFGEPVSCGDGMRCEGGACEAGDPVVLPSNSATIGTLEETGIELDVENGFIFDTDSNCFSGSALGQCAAVSAAESGEVCVCRADVVTLHDFEVRGSRALTILAWTSVTVKGDVVIAQGAGTAVRDTTEGSGGGSYGTVGGDSARPVYGTPELVPLLGGMSGEGMYPGTGGGALQISADMMVRVEGTINVPGGGAPITGCDRDGTQLTGDGGGSGGGLLVEARHVDVVGGVAANGGGGAGGGIRFADMSERCGEPGSDGLASGKDAASGGPGDRVECSVSNIVVAFGGAGGDGSIGDDGGGASGETLSGTDPECSTTVDGVNGFGGGGGGGGGRIRINTLSDPCGCTGFLSPAPTFGTVAVPGL